MKTEIRTREQIVELLFEKKKNLRGELDQLSELTEQIPGAAVHLTPELEILEMIAVKCAGEMTTFTGMNSALDLTLIESYMQNLSTAGETVFLLILEGRSEELGPDDVQGVCARADYYSTLEIDENVYPQTDIYIVGTFAPAHRYLYAPETMFRVAERSRQVKKPKKTRKPARVQKAENLTQAVRRNPAVFPFFLWPPDEGTAHTRAKLNRNHVSGAAARTS